MKTTQQQIDELTPLVDARWHEYKEKSKPAEKAQGAWWELQKKLDKLKARLEIEKEMANER